MKISQFFRCFNVLRFENFLCGYTVIAFHNRRIYPNTLTANQLIIYHRHLPIWLLTAVRMEILFIIFATSLCCTARLKITLSAIISSLKNNIHVLPNTLHYVIMVLLVLEKSYTIARRLYLPSALVSPASSRSRPPRRCKSLPLEPQNY